MKKMQEQFVFIEVEGQLGVGFVKVMMMCCNEVCCVLIDLSLFVDDKDMFEDFVVVVFNDVVCKVEVMLQEKMSGMMLGLLLFLGFKLLF